ncbi:hypothetical protein RJ639_036845 [Escallonia herrerae]|uniref:Golgi apparatus membrane protein TVP23 n=1 Tax=Escallonia herrerae TaxID=1293975 RepID=A0AA88WTT7_9ASTE|nr:hypothetical protein RJ639_036845 [Escallonia herrerae]
MLFFTSVLSLQGRTMHTRRYVSFTFSSRSCRFGCLFLRFFPCNSGSLCNIVFVLFWQAAALVFYILSAIFFDSFVIIFVVTVLLAALDFWVVKNVSGRILVGLRWWNEINDDGESVWKFECLDQESLARMNKKDSWLFWWTLYLTAVIWIMFGVFSLIRFQADYLLVVGVCVTLSIANIIGFTKCRKDAKKQIQAFASQTIASRFSSTLQSAFSVV